MNVRSLGALIALNVALLVALVVTVFTPAPATGQGFGARGDYIMISGAATGRSNQAAVYIVELRSSKMVVLFFNTANNQIEFMAARDIAADTVSGDRR